MGHRSVKRYQRPDEGHGTLLPQALQTTRTRVRSTVSNDRRLAVSLSRYLEGCCAAGERSIRIPQKLSFGHFLCAALALSFIVGFAIYVVTGATTDKGTTRAIGSESAIIKSAERASCSKYGKYASIATLRNEGLLASAPVYNSVVYLPGAGCGTIVIGSPAYQSPAG
jgi:hypothetical protein